MFLWILCILFCSTKKQTFFVSVSHSKLVLSVCLPIKKSSFFFLSIGLNRRASKALLASGCL